MYNWYFQNHPQFTEFTLSIGGKVVTLVNVQLESKNSAVTSLLIGCLMRKLDSRPHAFILTGYMPHVRPGNPAYELLREGYFGNHSIETLHRMRDIKLADEEERGKGLIDFVWKAYQHSRPWMRSVYETVLVSDSPRRLVCRVAGPEGVLTMICSENCFSIHAPSCATVLS